MNADSTNVKTLDAKEEESRKVFFQYSMKIFFAPLRLCVEGSRSLIGVYRRSSASPF
jgi:hypothetical protein